MINPYRLFTSLLLAALIAASLPPGVVHAQCTGDSTTVECTGVDPNGWDASVEAPGGTTTVTVRTGAQVDEGIFLDGADTVAVQAGGVVNSGSNQWAISGTNSSVTNAGTLNAIGNGGEHGIIDASHAHNTSSGVIHANDTNMGVGILLGPDGVAINDGAIDASGGLIAAGMASVSMTSAQFTNTGSLTVSSDSLALGIQCETCTASHVTNSGTITATSATTAIGIQALDAGALDVANTGTITATGPDGVGIALDTTYNASSTGQITNSGTITGSRASIRQAAGGSTLAVTNSGTLNGDVQLGDGNDSFTAEGGAVNGTLDGGDDFDTLTFAFDVLDVDYPALAALIATASPAGGSLSYGGATYTWINFEQLINLLNIVASNGGGEVIVSTGGIDDGRLNRLHPAATAIVYPLAEGGVELYTPQGEVALRAESDAIIAALAQAESSNAPVEISARLGLALIAQPDGLLLATGPGYTFAFAPAACGIAS